MLERTGWTTPDPESAPTGDDIVARNLEPPDGRDEAPFVLRVESSVGEPQPVLAKAVIDASGTWSTPNPLGADGLPALGEAATADRIFYGIPDVLDGEHDRKVPTCRRGRRLGLLGDHLQRQATCDRCAVEQGRDNKIKQDPTHMRSPI